MEQRETSRDETKPAVGFQPFAPGFDENPHPVFEQLREHAPIFYWEEGYSYLVTKHEDIMTLLRDERLTANRDAWELSGIGSTSVFPVFEKLFKDGLLSATDKNHARVRRLVGPVFNARAMEGLRPEVQAIVDELLASAVGKDTLDLAIDYVEHIPVRVIAAMLKIPRERDRSFIRFGDAVMQAAFPALVLPENIVYVTAALEEGVELIREVIEERRRAPLENDILSMLIQVEEQGDRLTKDELVALVTVLLVAGAESTVYMLLFALLNALRRPEVFEQVRAEPALVKNLVEESLRHDNLLKLGLMRYATEDIEIGGVTIKKGKMVMLMISSALRDKAAFPDAEVFDLRRGTETNLAFGSGPHFCLGAHLARLEGMVALGTLLERFPEMQIQEPVVYRGGHPVIRKIQSLKVSLRPSGAGASG